MTAKPLPIDNEFLSSTLEQLLRTPSPSGRTDQIVEIIGNCVADLGLSFELTRRGALLADIAGARDRPDRALVVHADTIGCMVSGLKDNGRLAIVPVGTHSARFSEGARVTIYPDDREVTYSGTILPLKASGHRFGTEIDTQGVGWDIVEVRVDERVETGADLAALGISVGDFVALDSQPQFSGSGFVKARHLDDKAGVAVVLAACKALLDSDAELPVTTHLLVTIAEEIGIGASHGLDADVAELVSIDNAVVAPDQNSREDTINIAMLDSTGPFDYHLTRRLCQLCVDHDLPYRRDVFGKYRSDAAAALEAGAETRAALVAFGVDASHGHERTHMDSLVALAELLTVYTQTELTFDEWDREPTGDLEHFPGPDVQPTEEQGPT